LALRFSSFPHSGEVLRIHHIAFLQRAAAGFIEAGAEEIEPCVVGASGSGAMDEVPVTSIGSG
jgi:hypothetical protein